MKTFEVDPIFRKTTLENGVRILTEHHPASRAVCAGITVDLGTRDEPEDMVGAAHFVEHMVFKGTETRDAYEIAKSLEAVGGELNAYTSREQTCFYGSTLKEHLPLTLDVLTDLLCNAEFEMTEFKRERDVITQEINMSVDQLDDYVFDVAFEKSFRGHELGRSILGTTKTLQSITRKKLLEFYHRRYYGQNMIVSVAGHVDHDEVVNTVRRTLNRRKLFHTPNRKKPTFKSFVEVRHRPSEQEHVLVVLPSVSVKDKFRFESYIANTALGGGMTSRLFQKIREKQGLAYTVYSYLQPFWDSGLQMIYAGTSGKHLPRVLGTIAKEIETLQKKGITAGELDFYKKQVIGGLVLESDDIENRMNSLAFNETTFGEYRAVDKTIEEIERVNVEQMNHFLKKYFDLGRVGVVIMGDINEDRVDSLVRKLL